MRRALVVWLWILAAVFILVFGYVALASRAATSPTNVPGPGAANAVSVVASRARTAEMGIYLNGLGTVTALKTVTVRTQVDGRLIAVAFEEGQLVQEGQLLAQIDPRPFQVQLEQAEGQQARDEATLKNAQLDLQRYQALVVTDAVPRQQLDTQVATINQLEGTLKTDRGQIDAARLNLAYARITSPITGRIGLRLVDVGNVVQTTDLNGLAVITQRQPITVVFTIPQDSLPDVLRRLHAHERLAVDAFDRTMTTKLASGTLSAVDSEIDPTTGTIKLKATFANQDEALFPNQFVNARLLVSTVRNAVIVPTAALQRGPQQTFVYVVNSQSVVEIRTVESSISEGDDSVIAKGLAAGETVVVDGVDRLQPGTHVAVREVDAPTQKAGP
jgi:membrane fusion protein, multidrug efflux system